MANGAPPHGSVLADEEEERHGAYPVVSDDSDEPAAWLHQHQPTTCRRIFLAALGGGGDLSAGPRGTNTVERSCGTGKKARCRPGRAQQRFLLLSEGGSAGLAGFRGAGGHTWAGRSRHGDDVGVTQAGDDGVDVQAAAAQAQARQQGAFAVGVTQPVSAASGPSASSPAGPSRRRRRGARCGLDRPEHGQFREVELDAHRMDSIVMRWRGC
ncbi:unnamed protein product [Miscanthus lutarioriparius]|uniref:Uncharacterized protein n=1 Tax=Miscanthus lutarioriparius TaxID=422564 RepID=A0A811SDK1_9POAL|nr:unnamed protein product [Miscanthus lutarioriparius]